MRKGLRNRPVCLSVINFLASYSDLGHLGSCLSTQSNENTKLTVSDSARSKCSLNAFLLGSVGTYPDALDVVRSLSRNQVVC